MHLSPYYEQHYNRTAVLIGVQQTRFSFYAIDMEVYHASIEIFFKMEMPIKWNIKMIIYLT